MRTNKRTIRFLATTAILIAIAALILGLVLPSYRASSETWPGAMLVVGDSITDGIGSSTSSRSFPERLVRLASSSSGIPVSLTIRGLGGATTDQIRLFVAGSSIPEPAYVIVEAGTNDITRTDIAAFEQGYSSLLESLTADPGSQLVCLGTWALPRNASQFDAVIEDRCLERRGIFVPLSDLYQISAMRGSVGSDDNFHPNDSGHLAIALRIASALRQGR